MLRSFNHSSLSYARILMMLVVVVVLPDPFRGMGARRNSAETQQSGGGGGGGGATPLGLDQVKNRERGAKDRFTKRSDAG